MGCANTLKNEYTRKVVYTKKRVHTKKWYTPKNGYTPFLVTPIFGYHHLRWMSPLVITTRHHLSPPSDITTRHHPSSSPNITTRHHHSLRWITPSGDTNRRVDPYHQMTPSEDTIRGWCITPKKHTPLLIYKKIRSIITIATRQWHVPSSMPRRSSLLLPLRLFHGQSPVRVPTRTGL